VASVGTEVALGLRLRLALPKLGPVSPSIAAGPGWEWLTTRAADGDEKATRHFSGPLWLTAELLATFALGRHANIGPALDAGVGTFTTFERTGPGLSTSGSIDERAPHGWITLGARVALVP
jgi:hypothetical protein